MLLNFFNMIVCCASFWGSHEPFDALNSFAPWIHSVETLYIINITGLSNVQ